MKVLLFGQIAEVVGNTSIEIKNPANTTELRKDLITRYPALGSHHFQLALNKEQVTSVRSLKDDDEIALLPPFSGG